MSMIGNFKTTSDADIAALLEKPTRIQKFLYGEEFIIEPEKKTFFGFFKDKASKEADYWMPNDSGEEFDVDKASQGIHFLLSGESEESENPLCFILSGGELVGDVDVGYGPARVFTSTQVKEIAQALSKLDEKELKSRCDSETFKKNEIYPDIWDEDFDESFGYILSYLEDLKPFIASAAENGKALIVYMN